MFLENTVNHTEKFEISDLGYLKLINKIEEIVKV